ncbi:MAG: chemotaxis protein CheB, partial [Candidatus Didemnitutus sp.]|nr:chemotaxis protein CheB [Candidatus Didemnitutus sp.]
MKKKLKQAPVPRLPAAVAPRKPSAAREGQRCPIVGIGASAGGLEAFTQLLSELPTDTGFGFVLVQHLDPLHESALAKLLARATAMPVSEVTDNLRVKANHIYIIPPNTSLGIVRGVLKLQPRASNRLAHRSIDAFFEALAKDQHEQAIGVILSGTATDGTLGLEAIKAEGGLTFAQDDSARYDSMPRSAAAAGCVDFVLSPDAIARELARIAKHPAVARQRVAGPTPRAGPASGSPAVESGPAETGEQAGYKKILALLRNHCGVDFSLYKSTTIHRRITRRIVLNHQNTLASYADFLRGNPKELDALYADALINVTSFFRNADAFEALKRDVFLPLLQSGSDESVRVWVVGCSTGQEAYSVAMAFTECAGQAAHPRKLQMFATDLNEANLDKARHGLYPKSIVQDVSPERLRRFFVEEDGGYRIIKSLRELVVFARQNLISDPPFSRMDLISCRNLLIYLEPSLQRKIFPAFHYALKPEGGLFLGASESIGGCADLFAPANKKQKIFTRKSVSARAFQLPVIHEAGESLRQERAPRVSPLRAKLPTGVPEPIPGEPNAEREADRVTVNQFAPPGVLINADLQILQFRGSTGAFLEPAAGKASFNLLQMAREGLMLPLRATINRAMKEDQTARTEDVPVGENGKTRRVHVEVVPLKNLKQRCFLVLFEDAEMSGSAARKDSSPALPEGQAQAERATATKESLRRIAALERALAETRDYLRSIQDQQEAANEELQASNEEGQSANEELQSLNEELETSKEELESTNEELTTVNEEMANRNLELNRLNGDLTNLQNSADLAVVLLRRNLTIRRFSARAEKQFNLRPSDVGRPMSDVRHNLRLSDLDAIFAGVIANLQECEREVCATDGRWYLLRVRPYLTLDRKVDGVVVVLVDVDDLKKTQRLITESHEHAAAIIRTVPTPLVILTGDLRVSTANEAFYRTFKVTADETKDRLIYEIDHGSWDIPRLRLLLEKIIPRDSFFDDFEVTHDFKRIGRRCLLLNARMLVEPSGRPKEILLGIHDITERKQMEDDLAETQAKLAKHAGELEVVVGRRTAELSATNRRLKASVASVQKSEAQFQGLFRESQVMQKRLRQLAHQILTAQEEERKSISRELHDEVVQTLVGINVELAALGRESSGGKRTLPGKIARAQRLVEKSVQEVHRFARNLRPAVLDDLGLIPALHAFSKSLAARKKFHIRLTAFRGVEQLGAAERTMFFRVAQEALNNVARHARASLVKV